jgi:PAS domain S-box-containing protein
MGRAPSITAASTSSSPKAPEIPDSECCAAPGRAVLNAEMAGKGDCGQKMAQGASRRPVRGKSLAAAPAPSQTAGMSLDGSVLESVSASPLAMVVTNPRRPDNPIEFANEAFCKLTGYSEGEVLGRNCRFLAGEHTERWVRDQIRTAIERRKPILVDILNYRRDGSEFRNGVMIAPLFDDEGNLAYFIGSQVDLGENDAAALSTRRARAASLIKDLPERQRQVLKGMSAGLLNKQIAFKLGIAEKTVKMHRALMLGRLGGITTAEAIRLAVEAGL